MTKPKWKLHRNKTTGAIASCRWSVDKNNSEEIEPYKFNDTLTYSHFYNSPSGIIITWKSNYHKGTEVNSSMDLLNDLFSSKISSNIKIKNTTPFKISGKFKFVKRGSEIRIIEIKNE